MWDEFLEFLESLENDDEQGPHIDLFHGLKRKTPLEGFMEAIETWEGGFQKMPQDSGNWVRTPNGRRLIGTMRGVTPYALAKHRGVPASSLTEADMRALTLEEAAEIGMVHYYKANGLNRLPYVPATEIWADIGWGSGPRFAVKKMQQMVGTGADGVIGPYTEKAYTEWVRALGHEQSVNEIYRWRRDFYLRISDPNSKNPRIRGNNKFRRGWLNRANHYLPGTRWWKTWVE